MQLALLSVLYCATLFSWYVFSNRQTCGGLRELNGLWKGNVMFQRFKVFSPLTLQVRTQQAFMLGFHTHPKVVFYMPVTLIWQPPSKNGILNLCDKPLTSYNLLHCACEIRIISCLEIIWSK